MPSVESVVKSLPVSKTKEAREIADKAAIDTQDLRYGVCLLRQSIYRMCEAIEAQEKAIQRLGAAKPARPKPARAPSALAQYIVKTVQTRLDGLDRRAVGEIYAVGLVPYTDTESPDLVLTVNDEATCRDAQARASGPAEARWNYAFWKQEPLWEIFAGEEGGAVMAAAFPAPRRSETKKFRDLVKAAGEAIRALHADGTLARVFGRPIPIVIHDLEGRDEGIDCTRESNPDGLGDEFADCGGGFA